MQATVLNIGIKSKTYQNMRVNDMTKSAKIIL